MTFDWARVIEHLRARPLVIVTKFDQNWFMHFGDTLDNMVDRRRKKKKEEFKRNRTQKFACVKKVRLFGHDLT